MCGICASYQDIETLVHQHIEKDRQVNDHWVTCMDIFVPLNGKHHDKVVFLFASALV